MMLTGHASAFCGSSSDISQSPEQLWQKKTGWVEPFKKLFCADSGRCRCLLRANE